MRESVAGVRDEVLGIAIDEDGELPGDVRVDTETGDSFGVQLAVLARWAFANVDGAMWRETLSWAWWHSDREGISEGCGLA